MYCYIHPEDQQDLSNVLEAGKEELENPSNEAAAGRYTDDIPFFGNEQGEISTVAWIEYQESSRVSIELSIDTHILVHYSILNSHGYVTQIHN